MTITNADTRKRLIINRHIAKMTPEEIARRFLLSERAVAKEAIKAAKLRIHDIAD